jgi:hypothetical protein
MWKHLRTGRVASEFFSGALCVIGFLLLWRALNLWKRDYVTNRSSGGSTRACACARARA